MVVTCPCGTEFEARSSRAKYCSDRCRKRPQRAGSVVNLPKKAASDPEIGPVEAATIAELTNAERLDTALGQACLVLARRLDHPGVDTGSALASISKRHAEQLAEATRGAGAQSATQQMRDELAERRRAHGA